MVLTKMKGNMDMESRFKDTVDRILTGSFLRIKEDDAKAPPLMMCMFALDSLLALFSFSFFKLTLSTLDLSCLSLFVVGDRCAP